MDKRKGNTDLTEGKVWKVIVRFALPLLVGNLLQQFYNITDSIIVGQFLGKEALAAVSASFFIYYFIISLVIGVGSGTTVVISQLFGAKQYQKVQLAFSSFFIFMLVGGIILSIAGIIFAEPVFRLTNTPEEVIPQAVAYFRIYIGGTFLFVTFNSIISILRGVGESVRPMLFILITTVLNIAFDLLFILVFKWGIEGAARATVVSQGIGMCIALAYVNNTHPLLSIKKQDMLFDWKLFKESLKIGLPTSVQQCAIALGLIALLGIVNSFGTNTLTAYGAAGKIDTIITQAILTLSGALAAFCGQNIGAGRLDRVKKGVQFTMYTNIALGLLTFCRRLSIRQRDDENFHERHRCRGDWKRISANYRWFLHCTWGTERVQRSTQGSWRYLVPNDNQPGLPLADPYSPRLLSQFMVGTQRNLVGDRYQHHNRTNRDLRLL